MRFGVMRWDGVPCDARGRALFVFRVQRALRSCNAYLVQHSGTEAVAAVVRVVFSLLLHARRSRPVPAYRDLAENPAGCNYDDNHNNLINGSSNINMLQAGSSNKPKVSPPRMPLAISSQRVNIWYHTDPHDQLKRVTWPRHI